MLTRLNMDAYAARAARLLLSDALDTLKSFEELLDRMDESHGLRCPECRWSHTSDNGCRGADLLFRCDVCGHEWQPEAP